MVFAGLIFYHVGLLYGPWTSYFMKSAHQHEAVELVLLTTHPWRMSLLFLVSGAATRFIADRRSPARLGWERTLRLAPPLLLGFFLLIPAQHYLTMLKVTPYDESLATYFKAFFASPDHTLLWRGGRFVLPVYGHLWFVLYLLTYTVALAAALTVLRGRYGALQRGVERLLSGPGLLIWPIAACVLLRATMYPQLGITLRYYDDAYNHVVSAGMFLIGFLTARSETVWADMVRLRWPALAVTAAAYAGYAALALRHGGVSEPIESAHPLMHGVYGAQQWAGIVAVLGFGRRWLTRGGPALSYLNQGVFTYYIVHQIALLAALFWLAPLKLGPVWEPVLVTAFTLASCALAYEAARRIGWLAPFLGQRPQRRRQNAGRNLPAPAE